MYFAGIELGGTKIVTGVSTAEGRLVERNAFETGEPESTLVRVRAEVLRYRANYDIGGLGIASFGPIFLAPEHPAYGCLGATPKIAWRGARLLEYFSKAFDMPVAIDTDVNAAALAEAKWGAGRKHKSVVYITVGTGIGAGILIDARPVHGLLHPEVGHMQARAVPGDDFVGVCPSHGGCIEGLASGPAISARWGSELSALPASHDAHAIVAAYLAQLIVNVVLTVSPEIVVLGGGVMNTERLHQRIRENVRSYLNDYIAAEQLRHGIDSYIVPPGLGADAGLLGATAIAMQKQEK